MRAVRFAMSSSTAAAVAAVLAIVQVLLTCSCRGGSRSTPGSAAPSGTSCSPVDAGSERAASPPTLSPLGGYSWMEPLMLPSGHRAVVTVPIGATGPRPIIVGVHGAGDRPDWACSGYRGATGAFAFVVCPEGVPFVGEKLLTSPLGRLEADIEAAIAATREKFGAYVAPGPALYAGFSLGAMRGVEVVAHHAASFPRVLLIEGGFREWTPSLAREFVAHGGQRVMLVCAGRDCRGRCGQAERDLSRAGALVTTVAAGTGRHNLDGEMANVLAQHWAWLVDGDPWWEGWHPP